MFKDAGLSSGYLWGPQSQPNTAHSLVPTSEEFPYLQHVEPCFVSTCVGPGNGENGFGIKQQVPDFKAF